MNAQTAALRDSLIHALQTFKVDDKGNPLNLSDPFEKAVADWNETVALLETVNDILKPAKSRELEDRKALANSLRTYFGDKLKEGTNNYVLSNGRKLKFGNKVTRSIDTGSVAASRKEFEGLNDLPEGFVFDKLLRVKYEVVAAEFKKLNTEGQARAMAVMMTTKEAAPELKVD